MYQSLLEGILHALLRILEGISCVLLGGGRIKLIYKIHIILVLVGYCLRFLKLLCLFLQKDNIRLADLVKIVRENISF